MPRYKITSMDTGRIFYENVDFGTVVKVLEVPQRECLALYTAEVGTVVELLLKPAHTGFKLYVEKIGD